MLKLCGQGFIFGHGRPVIRQYLGVRFSQIDHRLNSEKHAFFQYIACAPVAIVQNIGRRVENPTQPMAAEITYNRHPVGFDITLDGVPDITKCVAGLHRVDAPEQRIVGDLYQPLRPPRKFARDIHPACIAIPAINDHRDIDVENITVFQSLIARYSMTHDVIDADTARVLIAFVADRRRRRASFIDHACDSRIDVTRCGPRKYKWCDVIKNARGKVPCLAHASKVSIFKDADAVFCKAALPAVVQVVQVP